MGVIITSVHVPASPVLTSLRRQRCRDAWGDPPLLHPTQSTPLPVEPSASDPGRAPLPLAGGRKKKLPQRGCRAHASQTSSQGCSRPYGSQALFGEVAALSTGMNCGLSPHWFSRTGRGEKAVLRALPECHASCECHMSP